MDRVRLNVVWHELKEVVRKEGLVFRTVFAPDSLIFWTSKATACSEGEEGTAWFRSCIVDSW